MRNWLTPDTLDKVIIPLLSIVATVLVAYATTRFTLARERSSGKARLVELCRRYWLNVILAFDRDSLLLKADALTYACYVQELSKLVDDLDKLLANAYVERMLIANPTVTVLLVGLRRELLENSRQSSKTLNGPNRNNLTSAYALMRVAHRRRRIAPASIDGNIFEFARRLEHAGILTRAPN
jgi:hypothetical protein